MKACPDKNNKDWIELEKSFGTHRAHIAFYRQGDGGIPSIKDAAKLLNAEPNSPTAATKKFNDWVKNEPFSKPTFIETVSKAIKEKAEIFKNAGKQFTQTIFPTAFEKDNFANLAQTILRKNLGKKYREDVIADKSAKEAMDFWNKMPYNEQMHFMNAMENPKQYDLSDRPELQKMMADYQNRMDNVFNTIKGIKDIPYFEDYFPHFWRNQNAAKGFFSALSKRPLEGSKSFLRQRFFKDIKAGLEAGYELVTTNPEEIVRLAEVNATKFKMANDVFNDFKEKEMLAFVKSSDKAPDGYALVNDALFKRMAPFGVKVGAEEVSAAAEEGAAIKPEAGISMGGWYMPEDAARIVNAYLSRGFSGNELPIIRNTYQLATYINNLKNTFQLGFSGFHLLTTSIDASVTTASLGLVKMTTFKPKNMLEGLKMVGKGFAMIPAIKENYARSKSTKQDWFGGRIPIDVQHLIDVNGRIESEKMWSMNAEYNFKKAINRVKLGEGSKIPSALWNGLMTVPEYAAKPIMQVHVPAMKVAGFLKTVETELSLNPNLSAEEIQKVKEKAWDDMDDRLGQVVYDNLFWNKTLKDLSFMTIRSFGWTGGTIRAFGKGMMDIPESIIRVKEGKGISPRTAWMMTLPIQVGIYGAMYHYLMTGEKPKELKDYFFPKDGTKNPDGTDRRGSFPTYMKDVFAYSKSPYKTLKGKSSPFINEISEIYNNQDFYGVPIYDENDEFFMKGLADIAKYELKTFKPFGFRKRPGEEDESMLSQKSVESKIGFTQAPSEFTRTDLEETINERLIKEFDKTKRAPGYSPEQSVYKKMIAAQLKDGETFKGVDTELKQKAGMLDAQGNLKSASAAKTLVKGAKLTNAQRTFSFLSAEGQLDVVSKLNDAQFNELVPEKKFRRIIDIKKLINLNRTNPEIINKNKERIKAYNRLVPAKFAAELED